MDRPVFEGGKWSSMQRREMVLDALESMMLDINIVALNRAAE